MIGVINAGHITRMGDTRNSYKIFVGKPEERSTIGRPRGRWEDNFRMHRAELVCEGVDW